MDIFKDEKTSIDVGIYFWGSLAAASFAKQIIMGTCLVILGCLLLCAVIYWVIMLLANLIVTILMAHLLLEIFGCEWNDWRGVLILGACLIYNILCGCCICCNI